MSPEARDIIVYLRYSHGAFNLLMMLLFFRQGLYGLGIRRRRLSGAQTPLDAVKIHRKRGPALALLGVVGFLSGIFITLLDRGQVLVYGLHLSAGALIALFAALAFFSSKKIRGQKNGIRTLHFSSGLSAICLYPVQAFLGLGILL